MKKADLKTGVVYGYKPGKYDTLKPAVLVSTDLFHTNTGGYGRDVTGEPQFRKAGSSVTRPSKGYGWQGGDTGYLAISNASLRYSRNPKNALSLDDLTQITLEQVLKDFVHGKDAPEGYSVALINNSHLIGVYADLVAAEQQYAQSMKDYYAKKVAEAEAKVAAVQADHEAVASLGIAIPAPVVERKREWIQAENAYVESGRALNVEQVVMDRAEVTRLVVLVEHLRGLAMSTARSDEDREWIRLLTANDLEDPVPSGREPLDLLAQ